MSKPTELEEVVIHAKKLRPRTQELYLQHIRAFVEFAGANKSGWTKDAPQLWRESMQARKLQAKSINVALNALRFAARRLKGVPRDQAQRFFGAIETLPTEETPTKPTKKPAKKKLSEAEERALTWSEARSLLDTCRGIDRHSKRGRDLRDLAIVTLGLRTGMLRFSICKIKFSDFSKTHNIAAGCKLTFEKKGGEPHTISLDAVTADALADWISWLVENGHSSGPVFRALGQDDGQLKCRINEKGLTPDGLYRVLKERALDAGLKDIRPHVFRKTFISWAQAEGATPAQIAAVTGYTSDGDGQELGSDLPANMLLMDWRPVEDGKEPREQSSKGKRKRKRKSLPRNPAKQA